MTFKIWDGSVWRDPTFVRRWSGSAWVDVGQVSKWDGANWVQVWPSLVAAISDRFPFSLALFPGSALASYALLSSGSAQVDGSPVSGEWLVSGSASSFEVRATVQSGALTSGTTGSWLNLGTTREWVVERTTLGTNTCALLVEIRNASSGSVLDSATITLTAEVSI